jgi:hypothetical protein
VTKEPLLLGKKAKYWTKELLFPLVIRKCNKMYQELLSREGKDCPEPTVILHTSCWASCTVPLRRVQCKAHKLLRSVWKEQLPAIPISCRFQVSSSPSRFFVSCCGCSAVIFLLHLIAACSHFSSLIILRGWKNLSTK